MSLERFRGWTHRHFYVLLAFVAGVTFGVSVFALVRFSERSPVASRILRYGADATGNPDLDDDLVWFIAGSAAGAGIATLAAWRDGKARAAGLEEEDVLNRLIADPKSKDTT